MAHDAHRRRRARRRSVCGAVGGVALLAIGLGGCSEGWEGHCTAACAVVERCALDAADYPLHTYARYHFCCDPYVDGTTRRDEWEANGECLADCTNRASCAELDAWIRDRACCVGAGEVGACLAACGGY